ncbi:MAG: hypothetical protein IPK01_12535 [Acidobacteria bacterium]|nr:hypothetical protein [Acidobacteriota bacterium]
MSIWKDLKDFSLGFADQLILKVAVGNNASDKLVAVWIQTMFPQNVADRKVIVTTIKMFKGDG